MCHTSPTCHLHHFVSLWSLNWHFCVIHFPPVICIILCASKLAFLSQQYPICKKVCTQPKGWGVEAYKILRKKYPYFFLWCYPNFLFWLYPLLTLISEHLPILNFNYFFKFQEVKGAQNDKNLEDGLLEKKCRKQKLLKIKFSISNSIDLIFLVKFLMIFRIFRKWKGYQMTETLKMAS